MKTLLEIPEFLIETIEAINNIPYYWAELPLEDLAFLPQFNRKLVVSGFNCPDLEELDDERIYVSIKQLFIDKETGEVKIIKKHKPLEILTNFKSIFPNPADASKPILVNEKHYNDEGEEVELNKVILKVPSIKFIRFLLLNKQEHLKDLLHSALTDYLEKFKKEIDEFQM